ncbi:MAG TPA: bifunctional proline dehydrogenase/L-glutamate gamma-semialdehyde dehydrogenase PutA [Steroidobacteraceae bacterium]|nr:bifunctional proline dehydrogenase/L-glutamate gamma-semialdehyde dehydrogenase PutA [Steroidobacteraceae bacterium]
MGVRGAGAAQAAATMAEVPQDPLRRLRKELRKTVSERDAVAELLAALEDRGRQLGAAQSRAGRWVEAARARARPRPLVDTLLEQFPLDSSQGRALMSLAEALLRTADPARADQLISERLSELRNAQGSKGRSALLRVGVKVLGAVGRLLPNVSTELSGRFSASALTKPLVAPLLRASLRQIMERVGHSFIVGQSIESALARAQSDASLSLCSFDVLGEGARTDADAERYFQSYERAIAALGAQPAGAVHDRSGISIKLSALEPRYSLTQTARIHERLVPRMLSLAHNAAQAGIGLTIDAEEADRLDVSLDVLEALARDLRTRSWAGLGLAVQAYGRRGSQVIDWVAALARDTGRKMTVRLVKGAYWDTEIKRAQERGLSTFPVYTSKAATDASYLACAQRLFACADVLYPQFATHNAFTIAAVIGLAPPRTAYEFQRLHGMGEALYDTVREDVPNLPLVRVYAPVGTYEELLPYLVRRLLENGANSSFVHQFLNPQMPVEQVVRDPVATLVRTAGSSPSGMGARPVSADPSGIREPARLYEDRSNSRGLDWGNPAELEALQAGLRSLAGRSWAGGPVLNGRGVKDAAVAIHSPANHRDVVGQSRDASASEIVAALDAAHRAQPAWDATPATDRAACLERAADLLETRRVEFVSLLAREAGRTLPDAVSEVREAADFCRYYAARGREQFGAPQVLHGPTGERNLLSLHGRGVFVCISPWNFPLAIFTGQIVAALMAGNSVVAKPAPATPLIAHAMTLLLHEAGIPADVLQLTPSDGPAFSEVAMSHPALAGVAFTGSTATATTINRALAHREGPIVPLIAETGGVNAMIVDATALPEQVVDDVIASAFTSAGQRCSALRVLYLQEEIADRVLEMLIGAMGCLIIGDPTDAATDVGPVISEAAKARLAAHAQRMRQEATLLHACEVGPALADGHFFPPHLFQLRALDQLRTEEFGPILHVARFRSGELPQVLEAIRKSGYGLTLGIHSRIEGVAAHVFQAAPVGNTYVNRNMIGAVVGVQPFGGQGLSGTGPKAGGPHYLPRFATERTLTVNTVAIGGNVELLS